MYVRDPDPQCILHNISTPVGTSGEKAKNLNFSFGCHGWSDWWLILLSHFMLIEIVIFILKLR